MKDFDIILSDKNKVPMNVTDKNLYVYDFSSFSLVQLHQNASVLLVEKIKEKLSANMVNVSLIEELTKENKIEYVAKLSESVEEKLKKGELGFGIRKKTGEIYAVIKNTLTGEVVSTVTLEEKVVRDLGVLPELSAIQGQLASLSDQIENLNRIIQRVEQGQYNDRYAGFFSARQLMYEGMSSQDELIRKTLLLNAININNETIAKLMLSIHYDSIALLDVKTNPKEAMRIDTLLQTSLGYLNSSVQLNLIAYTALGERDALYSVLTNYLSFIEQNLLSPREDGKTVAWLLDNGQKGNDGILVELVVDVVNRIDKVTHTRQHEFKKVLDYEE